MQQIKLYELLDCFDSDLGNNHAWKLEHNVGKLQGILNSIYVTV